MNAISPPQSALKTFLSLSPHLHGLVAGFDGEPNAEFQLLIEEGKTHAERERIRAIFTTHRDPRYVPASEYINVDLCQPLTEHELHQTHVRIVSLDPIESLARISDFPYLEGVFIDCKFCAREDGGTGDVDWKLVTSFLPGRLRALCVRTDRYHRDDHTSKIFDALIPHLPRSLVSLDLGRSAVGQTGALLMKLHMPPLLRHLNLKDSGIVSEDLQILATCLPPTLRHLDLASNHLGGDTFKDFAARLPPELEYLELAKNDIGVVGAEALAAHMPKLRHLGLSTAFMNDAAIRIVAPRLPDTLRGLDLGENVGFGRDGVRVLAEHLPRLVRLQYLDICYLRIGSDGIHSLARCLPPSLVDLILGGNDLGDVGADHLARHLPRLELLRQLDLTHNSIGPIGIKALAHQLPPNLRDLDLQGNQFGDAGLEALAPHLSRLRRLRYLDLYHTGGLGDYAVRVLLPNLPRRLLELRVGPAKLDLDAVRMFGANLPLEIQHLTLINFRFGDAELRILGPLLPRSLCGLTIYSDSGTNFHTSAGFDYLKACLSPSCAIWQEDPTQDFDG